MLKVPAGQDCQHSAVGESGSPVDDEALIEFDVRNDVDIDSAIRAADE